MDKSILIRQKRHSYKALLLAVIVSSLWMTIVGCNTPQQTAQSAKYTEGVKKSSSDAGIACTYMRGGTSKGPFFDMRDLPQDIR